MSAKEGSRRGIGSRKVRSMSRASRTSRPCLRLGLPISPTERCTFSCTLPVHPRRPVGGVRIAPRTSQRRNSRLRHQLSLLLSHHQEDEVSRFGNRRWNAGHVEGISRRHLFGKNLAVAFLMREQDGHDRTLEIPAQNI